MYDEQKYIFQQFQKHFSGKKKEPLVLYGIGKNTGALLTRIQEYAIMGLMDGKKKEGTIWGKTILDYEDVLRLHVKTIVVIASPSVIRVIYRRIAGFCEENGITVYDIKGNDLAKIYRSQEKDNPYFSVHMQDLTEAIDKHSVIFFDIADTLIMRRVLYSTDIFTIVEREINAEGKMRFPAFASLRIKAEELLLERKKNPTMVEIYEKLQELSGISAIDRDEIMSLEIAAEMKFWIPRKEMLELYNSIRGKKNIYFISDLHLPRRAMGKILEKCGYQGYGDMIIFHEEGIGKSAVFFERLAERMRQGGYDRHSCLYVGDSSEEDFPEAEQAGIHTFRIMSPRELLENSSYRMLLDLEMNFMDHLAIGLLCEKAFHDPFALYGTKGRLKIESIQDFSQIILAPMIFYFTVWLIQQVCRWECDYVLYPSRDAYLIEKLCLAIGEKQEMECFPEGEYFYTSRRAMLAANIWDEKDIERVVKMDFWGTVGELFKRRFDIDVDSSVADADAQNQEILMGCVRKYQKEIFAQSEKEREKYIYYIKYNTKVSGYEKMALIDFVAAGKIQDGFERLVPDKDIRGFYFLRRQPSPGEIRRNIQVESFFPSKGAFEADENIYRCYLFLEMILTSPEPTFSAIGDRGEICFMEETRTREHREAVREMQESILHYAEEFAALCPDLLSGAVNQKVPDVILGFLDETYTSLDLGEILSLVLSDEFLGRKYNIFQT